jgi:serine/threonine-protein kinase
MAEVFLALARGPAGFNKLVVIKRLLPSMIEDALYRDMFLEEARLAARLNHPNVVATHEVSEHDNCFFLAMEYLEGQPLNRLLKVLKKRGELLRPAIAARIAADTLAGLHYAHELRDFDGTQLKIVHRDVSPQNIFVTYGGQVKVLDFGIAKAEKSNNKTQAGLLKGKAGYMAPEQLSGVPIDRRVDVFTTGIVLWELLCGRQLMSDTSTARTLMKLLHDPIPRVRDVVSDVPEGLDNIVAKALARDPDQRYSSAAEMRESLERFLMQSGESGVGEDLGRLVSELFAEDRETVQQQIREQASHAANHPVSGVEAIARVYEAESISSIRTSTSSTTGNPLVDPNSPSWHSLSGLGVSYHPTQASPGNNNQTVRPGKRDKTRTLLVAAGVMAVCVTVGTFAGRSMGTKSRGGASASAPPAVEEPIVVAPPSAAPAAEEPGATAAVPVVARPSAEVTHAAAPPRAPARPEPAPAPRRGYHAPEKAAPAPAKNPAPVQATPSAPPAADPAPARSAPPPAPTAEGRVIRTTL